MLRARRIARIVLATVVAMLTLAGVAQAGMMTTLRDVSEAPVAHDNAWPASRPSGPGSTAVAVVLGQSGTVGSDVLAPYEVFASSPAFSVYTVAEFDRPAPIAGGPALVPAYTFADVDSGIAPSPDVVVVPAVGEPAGEEEATMRRWILRQHDRGAHIFGVCSGSRVLAAAGVLDGRRATSHWARVDALQKSNPEVEWVRGHRYVQDGPVTTTAGVTSGIPGALKVVEDLVGSDEADRIGRSVKYPGWSLEAPSAIPEQHHTMDDLAVRLALVLPWMKPTVGVGITDDVGEIDLAADFEVYSTSYAARPLAIAPGDTITTRHGIVLLTTPISDDPDVDRVVVPGATSASEIDPQLRRWASDRNVGIEPLRSAEGGMGFDAALEDIAAHSSRTVALTVAKVIDYPVAHLDLSSSGTQWRLAALLFLTVVLALGIALLPSAVMKAVRRRRAQPASA